MARFPTAEERWPRAGEMLPVNKKDRAFCIGNGKSRSGYDLEKLRPKGLIFGCNAIHREFMPDVLTAVDHGMIHEVYHSGLAQKIPCYFRNWTKVPAMMYETMLYGGLEALEVEQIKQAGDYINENERGDSKEYVMHGANLKGQVKIRRKNELINKNVNHSIVHVSWIKEPDYSHSLTDVQEKDLGWACGASAGYVACKEYGAKEVFLIGHDLYSMDEKVNNLYAGTKHYVTKDHSPTPAVNWIRQWKAMFEGFPDTTFYKVNISNDGRDMVNAHIHEWKGTKNLFYIDYSTLDKELGIV